MLPCRYLSGPTRRIYGAIPTRVSPCIANPGDEFKGTQPCGMVVDRRGDHEFVHARPLEKCRKAAPDRVRRPDHRLAERMLHPGFFQG